jgi:hypothetical protein
VMRRTAGGGFGRGGRRGVGGGLNPSQECVCPNCGYRAPHQMGDPCNMKKCVKCGALMIRS